MEDKKDKHKSEINNTEWGLIIGALFTIDLVQWGLDFLIIGFVLNEFIDIFVGMSFGFYLLMKKQITTERAIVLVIGYLLEAGTDGVVPLWGLTGIYMYLNIKKKKIIGKVVGVIPGGSTVMKGVALKHRASDVKTIYKTFRPTSDIKSNDIKSVAISQQKNNIQKNTQPVTQLSRSIPSPQGNSNEIARIPQSSEERYNSQGAKETNNPQPKIVTSEDRVKYQKYFKELGVDHETATLKDVSSAMRNLTKINHPDRGGDLYQQQKIGAAYNELKGLFH